MHSACVYNLIEDSAREYCKTMDQMKPIKKNACVLALWYIVSYSCSYDGLYEV